METALDRWNIMRRLLESQQPAAGHRGKRRVWTNVPRDDPMGQETSTANRHLGKRLQRAMGQGGRVFRSDQL